MTNANANVTITKEEYIAIAERFHDFVRDELIRKYGDNYNLNIQQLGPIFKLLQTILFGWFAHPALEQDIDVRMAMILFLKESSTNCLTHVAEKLMEGEL